MREKSDDASRTRDEYRQREFLKSACEMREVVDQNENRTRAREETERQRDREIDTPGNETEETRSNRRVPHGVGCCCCCVCVCARLNRISSAALVEGETLEDRGEKKVTTTKVLPFWKKTKKKRGNFGAIFGNTEESTVHQEKPSSFANNTLLLLLLLLLSFGRSVCSVPPPL